MKKMVFVSLPMRGRSEGQIKHRQQEIFEEFCNGNEDITLINPFEGKDAQVTLCEVAGRPDVYWLGHSISQLSYADVVVFDKGWENYPGCRIEHKVATYYDIPIRYA